MSAAKRSRSTNFSKDEELMLLDEIFKFKEIIECRTTNKINWSEKESAWKKVLSSFNSKNNQARALEQLKSKYDNLKTRARKEVAKNKLNLYNTSGGPYRSVELDSCTEPVLNIINIKTVVGLESVYDSDRNDIDKEQSSMFDNIETIVEDNNKCNIQLNHDDLYIQESLCIPADVEKVNTNLAEEPLPYVKESPCTSWNNYVPNKLKSKTHTKLRPKVLNPIVEEKRLYYKRKLEVLNLEEERNRRQEERNIREQELRIKLLELELELKKKIR